MLYAATGALASALLTYGIGAMLGREVLRKWMGPRLTRIRQKIVKQGVLAIAAIRMVPVAPFTLVNIVAGASGIKLLDYTAGTLLGLLPGLILMSALGAQIARMVTAPSALEVAIVRAVHRGMDRIVVRHPGRDPPVRRSIPLSPDRRRSVRVMTWNIHGAFGRNPRFDLTRVVELILRADPDIIALQEVDSRHVPEGNAFALLQESLGSHGVGAASVVTKDGEYGQLLISRWPLHETSIRDISYGEREPRRAIRARVETPFGDLQAIATHLGLSIRERRSQARALLDMIGDASPCVALGDFNDWFWPGSVRSVLR